MCVKSFSSFFGGGSATPIGRSEGVQGVEWLVAPTPTPPLRLVRLARLVPCLRLLLSFAREPLCILSIMAFQVFGRTRDQDGFLHSYDDRPATVNPYGQRVWFWHGYMHREAGPALDGPYLFDTSSHSRWYLFDKQVSPRTHARLVGLAARWRRRHDQRRMLRSMRMSHAVRKEMRSREYSWNKWKWTHSIDVEDEDGRISLWELLDDDEHLVRAGVRAFRLDCAQ